MSFSLAVIVLALVWVTITDTFTLLGLLFGVVLGAVALWLVRDRMQSPVLARKARQAISLAVLFIYELTLSAIRVAILVLTPNLKEQLKPAIIAFPLTAKSDEEITLLANLITLTPGTLSVDVSEDRKTLYVHAIGMDSKERLIRDIASGFETKVIEVFE
jgi:multicomponent Na+:H+ antiporter subunit E